MNLLAKAYAVLLGVLSFWAWYTDITLLHSFRDHLAPDMFLAFACLPASLSVGFFPNGTAPLIQLAWVTLCAAAQAGVVLFVAGLLSKRIARNGHHDA
jgi:hypothetical protein